MPQKSRGESEGVGKRWLLQLAPRVRDLLVSIKINDDSMYLGIDGIVIATGKKRTDGWRGSQQLAQVLQSPPGDHGADGDRAAGERVRSQRSSGAVTPRGTEVTSRAGPVSALVAPWKPTSPRCPILVLARNMSEGSD